MGKAEIDREFRRYGRPYTEAQKQEIITGVASRMGIQDADDFYNTIGYGGLSVTKLSMKLRDEFFRVVTVETPPASAVTAADVATKPRKKHSGGVIIDGVEGCSVKFAHCCNPLPGDNIIGFITKGFGVSVHKRNCPNILSIYDKPDLAGRFVTAHWEVRPTATETTALRAHIRVLAEPTLTLIADIASALADMRISLHQINTKKLSDNAMLVSLMVGCRNTDHFKAILSRLRAVPGVVEAERGYVS